MAEPTEQCTYAHTYHSYDLGQNFWNYFAINFVSAISNYVPPDANNEVGDFLFGRTPFSDAAHEVLLAQPTFIVFFWLGVIISVVSIVGAITFLFPCARKWSTKHVSSKCMGATGLALSIVSFCFILWGTAMFILAHIASVSNDGYTMDEVYKNINLFNTTAGDQNLCFSRAAFYPIDKRIDELPNNTIAAFEKDTGLLGMLAVNTTALAEPLSNANMKAVNDILADLDKASKDKAITAVPAALQQVTDAIAAFQDIQQYMAGGLSNDITNYGKDIKNYQIQIEKYVNDVSKTTTYSASMNVSNMGRSVDEISNKTLAPMAYSISMIQHAANQIDSARTAASAIDSNWLVPRWLLFIPLLFALFASLIAIGFGAYYSCAKHQSPHKGMSCALVSFAIIVLALTSVVMIPTIAGMTYGYSTQASLDPFFNDYNLKGLHTMGFRLLNYSIPAMKGPEVVGTFADIMVTCKHEAIPFFAAAVRKNNDVIDEEKIAQSLNYDTLFGYLEDDLNDPFKYAPAIDKPKQDKIFDALSFIDRDLNSVPLGEASKADATLIDPIADAIGVFSNSLKPFVQNWLDAYSFHAAYRFTDLTNDTEIEIILGNEMSPMLLSLDKDMQDTAKTLHENLYKNGESCGNLYRSYGTAGDLATVDSAGYANGMWTAAGLAALFFVPLALALLLLSNAYRHGHGHHSHSVPAPIAKHSSAPAPAPVAQHQVVHSGSPVAPARVEAAPAVPARSTSAWQQPQQPTHTVYMPTDSYAPQPVQLQHFVDPLAAPAPAAYRRVGSPTQEFYPYPNSSRH